MGGTWADPVSRDGKLFCRRFRTTHEFFMDLVEKSKVLFPNHSINDAAGRKSAPIELKVLGVLRVLGRGGFVSMTALRALICIKKLTALSSINFVRSFQSHIIQYFVRDLPLWRN